MPATFKILDESYKTPNWDTILFSRYFEYLDDVEPIRPKELDKFLSDHYEELGTLDDKLIDSERENLAVLMFKARWAAMPSANKFKCYEFFCIDVGFWCGIEPSIIQEAMDLEQLQQTFWLLQYEMNPANAEINEEFTGFEVGGVEYLLPAKHMTESTVLEFSESAQFQARMKDVENGEYKAMVDVMCVLCRPKGEKYSYSKLRHNIRTKAFLSTTMDNVINTAFFLLRLNDILRNNLLIYTLMGEKEKLEAKSLKTHTDGIA
jgi:hypothetical protein